jgi:hypothetical protein
MAVVVGADGSLINTSNIIGSDLIPNLAPNIGALANVGGAMIDAPVTNEDGKITLPTIELKSRDPNLALGELQNLYGTKYMPMFQWVQAQQTGTMTYDPAEDLNMTSEEMDKIRQEFEGEFGVSAEQALMQAQIERAGQKVAGATAAGAGSAFGSALAGGAGVEEAAKAGFGAINPLNFLNKDKAPQQAVQAGRNLMAGGSTNAGISSGLTQATNYGDRVMNRLNFTTQAGRANLKTTGFAAGADFITQVAMGADPVEAAKDAGKTAVLSYIANAIIPGSGAIVGFLSKFI